MSNPGESVWTSAETMRRFADFIYFIIINIFTVLHG